MRRGGANLLLAMSHTHPQDQVPDDVHEADTIARGAFLLG